MRMQAWKAGGRVLVQSLITVFLIASFNFVLINFAPGDLADVMAGMSGSASESYMAEIRQKYGLDQPYYWRYANYLLDLLQGNFGFSARYNAPVFDVILERLPATLLLLISSIGMAFILGLAGGVIAARRVNSWVDAVISALALLAYATPLFWLGLMLNTLFALKLGWLPTGGYRTVGLGGNGLVIALDILRHMILPAMTLAFFYLAVFAKITRGAILEVQDMDYVRTARAKGLHAGRILVRHVMRNAMLPIVTALGIQIGAILGGSIVVETVFGWPGLGRLAYDAVMQRDVRLLLAILLLSSILVIVVNLIVDMLYRLLDPRISEGRT